MSDRNNTFKAIITVAFVLSASIITAVFVVGQLDFDWYNPDDYDLDPNADEYYFTFEEVSLSIPALVMINIEIDVGGVNVFFEDNSTLVYRLDITISNETYVHHGVPNPLYTSPTLDFSYPVLVANITLGSSTFYRFDIDVDVGSVDIYAEDFAHLSRVGLHVGVGSIRCVLLDTITLNSNITVDLHVGVGNIDIIIGLPATIGGRITGSTSTGDFDAYSFGWDQITEYIYETPNIDTADYIINVISYVGTGSQLIVMNYG